jgi:hypothetical protein
MKKKRKRKKRTPYQKQKKHTDDWCSRYIRIRDAIEYHKLYVPHGEPIQFGQCYTCRKVIQIKKNHSGHFKSRGLGGSSGIYFDERAIHLQCVQCNAFGQGKPDEYEEHLIEDYGKKVVEELKIKHKANSYDMNELIGLELYFSKQVLKWCDEYSIVKWWEKGKN